jgi:hypothetical protein
MSPRRRSRPSSVRARAVPPAEAGGAGSLAFLIGLALAYVLSAI